MPTITNESVPGATGQAATSGTPNAANAGQTPRREAVGAEIPVVVHASRSSSSVKGIAKPLPAVHEETRTVIVFPHGAVVRLTAEVSNGELIVLTNQKSGADVLCRVASVKAQPGIQNYVDLEFTQRAPGFWGECFPSERGTAAAPASVQVPGQVPGQAPVPASPAAPVAAAPPPSTSPSPIVQPAAASTATMDASPVAPQVATPATIPSVVPQPAKRAQLLAEEAVPVSIPAAMSPSPSDSDNSADFLSADARSAGLPRSQGAQEWAAQTGPEFHTESAEGPNKTLLLVIAAIVLVGLIFGGYMLMRGHSTDQAAQPAPAAQSQPTQQPIQAQGAPASQQSGVSIEAAAQPVSSVPAAIRPAVISSELATPAAPSRPAVVAPAAKPTAPSRAIGKIEAPRARMSTATSAEAPPSLPAATGASPLSGSLVVATAPANAPPPPPSAPAASPVFTAPVQANFLAGGRFTDPKLVFSPSPLYPVTARAQHVQGDVLLDVLVDGSGHVSVVKAISGPAALQQAAIDAVRRWTYKPAQLDGETKATHVQVKITFRLP